MGIVDNDEFEKIVEDAFESNDRVHIFSEKYSSRKEKLLRGCNMKRNIKDVWKKALIYAACGVGVIGAAGGTAYAINNPSANVASMYNSNYSHAEEGYTETYEKEGNTYQADIPRTDVYEYDGVVAAKYLNDHVYDEPVVLEANGYTFTLLSLIKDSGSAIAYYKIENPDGVDIFAQHDSNLVVGKGYRVDVSKSSIYWYIMGTTGKKYMDTEKSIDTCVYMTEYMPLVGTEPYTIELDAYKGPMESNIPSKVSNVKEINGVTEIASVEGVKDGEAYVRMSPISISTYTEKVTNGSTDPYSIKSLSVIYKDGSIYEVSKREVVENNFYACGMGSETCFILNRIVDIENVESIEINGEYYTVQN